MDTSVHVKSFLTSTHYQHITALPKDTPFTCSSTEIRFNVLNVTLVSTQIPLKQLKSITSPPALPERDVLKQLFSCSQENKHICPHFKLHMLHEWMQKQSFSIVF